MKNKIKKEKGQVVLMVLLASALILTLGLSASKQATIETKIDTDQELLKKAFNAAESGIEYYLGTGGVNYNGGENDGMADVSVKTVGDSESLSFGDVTLDGGVDYFWLVNHNTDGTLGSDYYSSQTSGLNICTVDRTNISFGLSYFYKVGSDFRVLNTLVDTTNGCVVNFNLTSGNSILLAVTPIGSGVKIELTGGANFPVQGEEISSVGSVQGVNNTVTVLNRYVVPEFLLEAVSSGGDVSN